MVIGTHLMPLSTCVTQLLLPSSIVTTGVLNPSLDIRLIFASRCAPRALVTAVHN